jgi:arylsulfatase A-like enzyme
VDWHRGALPAAVGLRAAARRGARLAGVGLVAAAMVSVACRRQAVEGFELRPAVEAGRFAVVGSTAAAAAGEAPREGLRFAAAPALGTVEVDHEARQVVLASSAPWSWTGRVPAQGALHAGVQVAPAARGQVRRFQAVAVLFAGAEREVLQVARSVERLDPVWLDLSADLTRYAGRRVTLQFSVTLVGLPPAASRDNLVAWGPVSVTGAAAAPRAAEGGATAGGGRRPPNIVMILVDTMRRDRLTPYGYGRATTPAMARWLAAPGTVVEEAYRGAPWTLPSVVSLFTGRYPGEMLGSDLSAFGIPPEIAPLAERLRAAGFDTAGFLANPTLHVGAGFERGFSTFYAPPADLTWINRHADDLNRHALPWIAAHQDEARPFFLYLHYVDPHDPYLNPDIVANQSPFEDHYSGPVTGDWVHGIYSGKIVLQDPVRDIAHLSSLYDAEVHYADRYIGEALASFRPEVLANTVFVLTADHGEELFDHGGWKHGQTTYEEQVHVPLLWRWDGHIRAGARLAGTVRLLDVAPTLAAAAGAPADPGWEGANLLPALTGAQPLAERPAFVEGLSGGPLRAAAVLGGEKLMVFNREEPFKPADELQDHNWHVDLARLHRLELYDLKADPGEHHDLLGGGGAGGGSGVRSGAAAAPVAIAVPPGVVAPGSGAVASGSGAAGSGAAASGAIAAPPGAVAPGAGGAAPGVGGAAPGAGGAAPASGAAAPGAAAAAMADRRVRLLAAVIERRLDRSLPGLRLMAAGVPAGAHLRIDLALAQAPRGWTPFLLTAADRVSVAGSHLVLDLAGGDLLARGVRIAGDAAVAGMTATLDGRPLAAERLRVGAGRPYGGGALAAAALTCREWPADLDGAPAASLSSNLPVVGLWVHDAAGEVARRTAHDAETERGLRALGYIE